MPVLENVKTVGSQSIWKSPDGSREIFEVALEYEGKQLKAKTYSKDISKDGWSGTVETYDKQGRNGSETFVKQPPKEGGFTPGAKGGGFNRQPADQFTMYLSYAKDLVVALQETSGFDPDKFKTLLKATADGGKALYDQRPGAERVLSASKTETETPAKAVDEVIDVNDDADVASLLATEAASLFDDEGVDEPA